MATIEPEQLEGSGAAPASSAAEGVRFGPFLALWIVLAIAIHGLLWLGGVSGGALASAVERGAARAETRGIGEVGDDLIRHAIETQRETLPFWMALALIGDFLAEPFALAARALASATAFAALAALVGRPVHYERTLDDCAAWQGAWVVGLAVHAGLAVALGRADVETSPALFLPAGTYPAPAWLALRQLDPFAILGWAALARGGWRRGQVGLATAAAVVLTLGLVEAALRVGLALVVGSGMRLDLISG